MIYLGLYILKVNLLFSMLYLGYILWTKSSVHHHWNRWYLVLAPAIALGTPLIELTGSEGALYVVDLAPIVMDPSIAVQKMSTAFTLSDLLLIIWSMGMVFQLIRSIGKAVEVKRLLKNPEGVMAFTFLRFIRIDPGLSGHLRERIQLHEAVHARQLHSLDLMWYELLQVVFWFNPLFNFGQRSLKRIHEFIADREVSKTDETYQETLLAHAFGVESIPLINEFQSMGLKTRLKMLNKTDSKSQWVRSIVGGFSAMILVVLGSLTLLSCEQKQLNDDEIYMVVDEMPRFPGCEEMEGTIDERRACSQQELFEFIGENLVYPQDAKDAGESGMVFVSFVIDVSGSIESERILRSPSESLSQAALEILDEMPDWIPGVQDGRNVNVQFNLPIRFELQD